MNKKILTFLFIVSLIGGLGTYASHVGAANGNSGKSGEEDSGGFSGENEGNGNGSGGNGFGGGIGNNSNVMNMFGWAWGGTTEGMPQSSTPNSGVGWIKFNSCNDVSPRDGMPDSNCNPSYAVKVDMNNGNMSGDGWSSNIGWVSFNRSETGNPPSDDPGSGSGAIAKINMSNGSQSGKITGWARVLSAMSDTTDGWDGWIHLSDNNSNPSRHPSGPSYIDGSRGVTYNPNAGTIVGYGWGSQVVGWVKFVAVTLGAPIGPFDFTLSNNGNLEVGSGSSVQSVITRNYVSGTSEPVTISIVSPAISGVTPVIGSNNPCSPYCSSNITFNVANGTAPGTHNVIVRGRSTSGIEKTTSFNLIIGEPNTGELQVSCQVNSQPPYLINQPVTWEARVLGSGPAAGIPPYSASWRFVSENEAVSTVPPGAPQTNPVFTIQKNYPKIGLKTAMATITDSSIPALVGVCEEAAEINVVVKTNIIPK